MAWQECENYEEILGADYLKKATGDVITDCNLTNFVVGLRVFQISSNSANAPSTGFGIMLNYDYSTGNTGSSIQIVFMGDYMYLRRRTSGVWNTNWRTFTST